MSNYVSTSKYNMLTFVPKFLTEQFSKYANLFFLFTACIQQIPDVSPTNQYTTIAPLAVVLLASAFKEVQEDLALNPQGSFDDRKWKDISVGDVVRLESDEFIPADMVLLSSSEPEGLCYIETSNLDGLPANITNDLPNMVTPYMALYVPNNPTTPFTLLKELWNSSQIRNTPWLYGLVVFTGHETKLMRNATAAPIKRTAVERQVNVQIVYLFILLLLLSIGSTVGSSIRTWFFSSAQWYLFETTTLGARAKFFIEDILTFIILYNNLIHLSDCHNGGGQVSTGATNQFRP
ncbi:hypothetical protein D9757_006184 [Collybiopsis confluens]|uniref:P-type ATPase N-terminal domain-containing protein n=1 Tax=Collybiopsis confluens TaxID=2823264 RepID=A0A8H5HI73_9AGAR|nr:hypothetical protein D9757_006184 [Collybiopsis confluens]